MFGNDFIQKLQAQSQLSQPSDAPINTIRSLLDESAGLFPLQEETASMNNNHASDDHTPRDGEGSRALITGPRREGPGDHDDPDDPDDLSGGDAGCGRGGGDAGVPNGVPNNVLPQPSANESTSQFEKPKVFPPESFDPLKNT